MSSIKGKIQNSQTFTIDKETVIEGEIITENLEVFGKFEGSIVAKGIVSIYPSAEVKGWIKSGRLVVHPGAKVQLTNAPEEQ